MYKLLKFVSVGAAVLSIAACGGGSSGTSAVSTSTARGSLSENPPFRIASLDAASFNAQLGASATGAQLLLLTGAPACGVDFYYMKFWTVGGANESTQSSGALMVPTGASPTCSGPRPVLLYAHGTQTDKTANIADITNPANSEGVLIAATFAAQGYIVVAPNYAGYDISTLGYHPYLNAQQQSGEMIDSLAAARTALPKTQAAATTDSGKLFITGYSQGGYVALATQRAMQAAGSKITAVGGMSGPYALEAFGDALFFGGVDLGSTVFGPLLTTSYQHAYGNIYAATTDVYNATYATGIDTLLPSATSINTLFSSGKLPETALFDVATPVVAIPGQAALSGFLNVALAVPMDPMNPQTPLFQLGFGTSYLINNNYRVSYAVDAAGHPDGAVPLPTAPTPAGLGLAAAAPTQTLRLAFYKNDLRNGAWAPLEPTLLCGGSQDPTVFFSVNTETMEGFWAGLSPNPITVLDVNATPAAPFALIQGGFQASQAQELAYLQTTAGGGLTLPAAEAQLVQGYHGAVAPFCSVAVRSFFANF